MIALNRSEPWTRQRFTLLHEYKHIVDHGSVKTLYPGACNREHVEGARPVSCRAGYGWVRPPGALRTVSRNQGYGLADAGVATDEPVEPGRGQLDMYRRVRDDQAQLAMTGQGRAAEPVPARGTVLGRSAGPRSYRAPVSLCRGRRPRAGQYGADRRC